MYNLYDEEDEDERRISKVCVRVCKISFDANLFLVFHLLLVHKQDSSLCFLLPV